VSTEYLARVRTEYIVRVRTVEVRRAKLARSTEDEHIVLRIGKFGEHGVPRIYEQRVLRMSEHGVQRG
jgi:hypothetical protein